MEERLVITAASEKFAPSLFACIGAINCNWPGHPRIVVYDLGLRGSTLEALRNARIEVIQVPSFCSHWQKHYTWKFWCINNACARNVLWIDAGICVLDELDEVWRWLAQDGYFFVPNRQFLDYEASSDACNGCGVSYEFRIGKPSIAAGFAGYRKTGKTQELLEEAMRVASIEKNIAATSPTHRHDQAILSLLAYRYFTTPVLHEYEKYLNSSGPKACALQKVWVHRRSMLSEDIRLLGSFLGKPGLRYIPKDPIRDISFVRRGWRAAMFAAKRRLVRAINHSFVDLRSGKVS